MAEEGRNFLNETTGAIEHRSLQEKVYQRLRWFIFNRELDTEPVKIQQLADSFGVSPMPVREALRRLEADGLVTFTRNKAIVISRLSPEEVGDIFEVRLRLEPYAGCRAADRITAEGLKELETLYGRLNDFSDGDRWRANNAAFHRIIVEACGIVKLASMIDNLWLAMEPYRRYYVHDHRLLEAAQVQHGEIMKSLREKDGRRVGGILEHHLTDTLGAILRGMGRDRPTLRDGR